MIRTRKPKLLVMAAWEGSLLIEATMDLLVARMEVAIVEVITVVIVAAIHAEAIVAVITMP